MSDYEIIPNAPLAETRFYTPRGVQYPFADMAVGDAFDVDWETEGKKARSAAGNWSRKNGGKFATCRMSRKVLRVKRIS